VKRSCHNADLHPAAARSPRREGPRARPAAFTLVELLTIIVILGMLISLATPSVMEAIKIYRTHETRGYFRQLAMGIGLYQDDWKQLRPKDPGGAQYWDQLPDYLKGLPPSSGGKSDSVAGSLKGAYALVQALTGYRSDDGKPGRGSKYIDPTIAPGKQYGPYVATGMPMDTDANGLVFLDAFGNRILYFRFEPGAGEFGGTFVSAHNDGGPTQLQPYLLDPNGDLYRKDYILMTPGPDRVWRKVGTDEKIDDIANFQFRYDEEYHRGQK